MKQLTQVVLLLLATAPFAGVVQAAGRGVDNPLPLHKAAAMGGGAYGANGVVYSGRPNDSSAFPHRRGSEGQAEFAVMEMHEGGASHGTSAYHGRPMDNPRAQLR